MTKVGAAMSQYFGMGEETLWNPSNGAARLFLRQIAVFEAELGLPSGVGPMENDECQVDPVALGAFANALLAQHQRTRHAIVLALSEGFLATLLVLAERAGAEVGWTPADNAQDDGLRDLQVSPHPRTPAPSAKKAHGGQLRTKMQELARFMAR
ncbi:hypothetical protein Sgleb_06800 [Streptomyces glebosus]|uniref:Uncharacterized protein n=1 Tax=Streptomyces glebosus TaxID=249580 RepID=A0A640SMA2_9ACTN|nr:DUF6086 family protein [Streptomyces glebosus]GFE12633.1 hypothetical protein Sgleb_06800 [Streptomyces glebosus]